MKLVAFGSQTKSRFPYQDLLAAIPAEGRYYVGASSGSGVSHLEANADPRIKGSGGIREISIEECRGLPAQETIAIVVEPLWVSAFQGWWPGRLVLVSADLSVDTAAQRRWMGFVVASAEAVFVPLETQYLQWCFQRPAVFFWDPHRDREEAVEWGARVVQALENGDKLGNLEREQWHSRLKEYESLLGLEDISEKAFYFSAAYRYLLEDDRARDDLLAAFERAVMAGRADCLVTHYRFLSAILAKQGRLEEAVQVFGITAIDQHTKKVYERLLTWLGEGHRALVQAELFVLNDDLRSARKVLRGMDGEDVEQLWMEISIRTGYPDPGLRRVMRAHGKNDLVNPTFEILRGFSCWLRGDHPEAIHHFLRAAAKDPHALSYVLEMEETEILLGRIRGEERVS